MSVKEKKTSFAPGPQVSASSSFSSALNLLFALAIIIVAIIVYHGTLDNPFAFDDEFSIVKNASIRGPHLTDALFSQPGNGNPVQGRPILNLTFAINYAVGGLDPRGYHLFNLVVHCAVALLLFGFIRRTLQMQSIPGRVRQHAAGIAFSTALLFAVHPLGTGAVTYVTQRAESLAALFYLLMFYGVLRSSAATGRYAAIAWSCVAVASCGLGMGTKEVLVSAPLIALLYAGQFLSKGIMQALRRRLPLYGALAATWVVLGVLVAGTQGRGGTAEIGGGALSLHYAGTQLWAIVHYLRLCFWPSPLVLDYGIMQASIGEIVSSGIVVVTILTAMVLGYRRYPQIVFVMVFIFAVLAPSSSIVAITTQTVAEHRMYLPLAAVLLLTVLALFKAGDLLAERIPLLAPVPVRIVLVIVAATVLGNATVQRNRDYASELAIWQDTADKRPKNVRAAVYLGATLINQNGGKPPWELLARAIGVFDKALALDSAYGLAYANRGLANHRMGRVDEALRDYGKAIAVQSKQGNRAEMYNNRGILLGEIGRTDDAIADFSMALQIDPSFASAFNNLGSAYTNSGKALLAAGDSTSATLDFRNAIAQYTQAIKNDKTMVSAFRGRASVHAIMGNYNNAAEDCSFVIAIDPTDAVAYGDRAICRYQLGNYQEAWQDVEQCRRQGGMPNTELVLRLAEATGVSR